MFTHLARVRLGVVVTSVFILQLILPSAQSATIQSLGGIQRGGDLYANVLPGLETYTQLRASLLEAGHQILPGIGIPRRDDLLGVDLFYWGVVDSVGQTFQLTDEQSAELRRHVSDGGSLLIEADSGEDLQAAQAALRAVVGADWIEGGGFGVGSNGPNAGQFSTADTEVLVGPWGDLRSQTFGTTSGAHIPSARLDALSDTIIGTSLYQGFTFNTLVQMRPFAGGGRVVFVGDPVFSDQFTRSSSPWFNPNNVLAFMNLVAAEENPRPALCDLNADLLCTSADIDLLTAAIANQAFTPPLDLDQDGFLTNSDRVVWVSQRMNTYFGDADLNGEFNSSDLVTILGSGSYESDTDSFWSSGDFDGDGRTDSSDLVAALADGGYEMGPRASTASVPEPSSIFLLALAILPFGRRTKQ